MTIQFNSIPGNVRVPLWYAEFNAAQSPFQSIARLLLVGQLRSTGTATAEEPVQVEGNEDGLFGYGSMLSAMCRIARRNAPFQEVWALPLADEGAGVAATGKITIATGSPSANGTLTVYLGTTRVRVGVSTADDQDSIATALAAAINATPHLPVTAAVNGANADEVDITFRHKGTMGNHFLIHIDYRGDEGPLAAELVTITAMANGATDPDISAALAALGDEEYDWIAGPYTDSTNTDAVTALLNNETGRWSPFSQLYGHYITHKSDTQANLSTFGNTLNDPHISVMGSRNSPSPPWEWAAALGAVAAAHLQDAPELSRPLHTLVLQGIWAPKLKSDRFSQQQRQTLYYDGISGYHVRRDGQVAIDRVITTYQTNAWSVPDASWLDIETMAQGMFAIRYLKAKVVGQWGRAALRDENPLGIPGVATPADVRDTIVHGYRELSALNVVENEDLFEQLLIVERAQDDATRLDILLPIDHVNQLRIIAVNATSYLQFTQ